MKFLNRVLLAMMVVVMVLVAPPGRAQTSMQKTEKKAAAPEAKTQKTNTDAYIALLRRDVRQEKAEIMGSMMALNAQDSAKFWPIYGDYDAQLSKLNDQRVQNIMDYVANYSQMTDEKADELIQKSMAYQKARAELVAQTYEKVKQALGAITAARFALVEHQILSLIDLEIVSSLPISGQEM